VFTNDPHSVPLGVVLGGGIIAGVLVAIAFVVLLWTTVTVADSAGRPRGLALIASTPVVLLGVGLVSWVAPAAMIASMAITGACLGAHRAKQPAGGSGITWVQRAAWAAAGVLVAVSLALAVAGSLSLPAEYAYVYTLGTLFSSGRHDASDYATSLELISAYRSWPAPVLAHQALKGLIPQIKLGNPDAVARAENLLLQTERDAGWSGELALFQLLAAEALDKDSQARFGRYAAIAQRAAKADPSTGLWWALAANQASRLGLVKREAAYVKRALEYPVDSETRVYLEGLAPR